MSGQHALGGRRGTHQHGITAAPSDKQWRVAAGTGAGAASVGTHAHALRGCGSVGVFVVRVFACVNVGVCVCIATRTVQNHQNQQAYHTHIRTGIIGFVTRGGKPARFPFDPLVCRLPPNLPPAENSCSSESCSGRQA